MKLRKLQQEFKNIRDGIINGTKINKIIIHGTPGSGKSLIPVLAGELITAGLADALCWIVPRKTLQYQAESNFQDLFFRKMLDRKLTIRASTNDINPCRGLQGFVSTYQALSVDEKQTVLSDFKVKRYILILDEFHHVSASGADTSWYDAIKPLVDHAKYLILLTGTMSRGDGEQIAFVPYDQIGTELTPRLQPDETTAIIRYLRKDALAEKAILPLNFHLADGHAKWINKDGAFRQSDISKAPQNIASQALFTAISTDFAKDLLERCLAHWQKLRSHNPRAKLMVVTANYKEAKKVAKALKDKWFHSEIATSHESERAHQAIKRFKNGTIDVLVSINICYEGLDVPEITHIACLTNIRSTPWIEQMVARAVRIDSQAGPYGSQVGFIYAPDDTFFREIVKRIEKEQRPFIKSHKKQQIDMFDESEGDGNWGTIIQIQPLASNLNGQREVFLGADYAAPALVPETPSEIEASLHDQIESHVRQFSFINRYNPKRLNAEIKRHFNNKARAAMTSDELEAVLAYVKRTYPLKNGTTGFTMSPSGSYAKPRGGGVRVKTKAVKVQIDTSEPWLAYPGDIKRMP